MIEDRKVPNRVGTLLRENRELGGQPSIRYAGAGWNRTALSGAYLTVP